MRTQIRGLKAALSILVLIGVLLVQCISVPPPLAEVSPSTVPAPLTFKTFAIEPASTWLAGGKVNLTVKPMVLEGAACHGDYELKITPYFFKNESGKISMAFPKDLHVRLAQKLPTKFTGTARTNQSDKIRPIEGIATPTTNNKGSVTFSIKTENGALVFKSPYTLSDK